MMVAQLAMAERDPASRVRQTHEIMSRLKGSRQSAGIQGLEALGDLTSVRSFGAFARIALLTRPFNIVITNVPGPPMPT